MQMRCPLPISRKQTQEPATVVPHLDVALWCFCKMILLSTSPRLMHTQPRSRVTAARRLFFDVYHASFQHPPLAELALTAPVEASRLAGLQGRCTRGRCVHHQRVREQENEAVTAEKLKQGCGETGLNPRSGFITHSLTAMLRNAEIKQEEKKKAQGCEGARRPSEGARR